MKSLKKKRRIQVLIAAAVALVVAAVLIGYGFRDGINLYRSPTQLAEAPPPAGEVFRLGGLVEDGSLVRGEGETVSFSVTDGGGTVPVTFRGVLPDLFKEGRGVVAQGRLEDGGVFVAREVLAKHDENYMPREVSDSLKEQGVYKGPTS